VIGAVLVAPASWFFGCVIENILGHRLRPKNPEDQRYPDAARSLSILTGVAIVVFYNKVWFFALAFVLGMLVSQFCRPNF
jgi:hypothetical protein